MAFVYLNVNPLSLTEEDCVTRAISLASGYSYAAIQDKLYYVSQLLECDSLVLGCYKHLLDDVFRYPRVYCEGMTVADFAYTHPEGVYLVRMNGHISTVAHGDIYDIWDCGDEIITDCWRTA